MLYKVAKKMAIFVISSGLIALTELGSIFLNFLPFMKICVKILSRKIHCTVMYLLNKDNVSYKIFKVKAG